MLKAKYVLTGISALLVLGISYVGYGYLTSQHLQEVPVNENSLINNSEEPVMPQPERDEVLEGLIRDWAGSQTGEFGVSVREVSAPQRYATFQSDKSMIAASTYKLFLIHAILHEVDQGRFTLETPVGNLTIRSCIDSLLEVSSDACAYDLGNLIGWEAVDGFINASGFKSTVINNYTASGGFSAQEKLSTADDQAELAWRLATGKLLSEEHTEFVLPIMKRQIWRERIVAGVPTGIEVASKPGFIYAVQNDTGIVYGSKSTYVIALMSDGSSAASLAELSKIIYDYLNK